MEQNKIDVFIAANADNFPPERIPQITEVLKQLSDEKFTALQSIPYKKPMTILIISLVLGSIGVDRFMLEETGLGIAKLLTCGGFGIWTIIDWFLVSDKAREYNFNKFIKIASI